MKKWQKARGFLLFFCKVSLKIFNSPLIISYSKSKVWTNGCKCGRMALKRCVWQNGIEDMRVALQGGGKMRQRNRPHVSKKGNEAMRKILVVVDMQNDFIDGALGTKEAVAIVPAVKRKIKKYRPEDIFVTQDTHKKNYMETQEGKNLPVVHCVKGTPGWEISPKLKNALDGAEVFQKPTFGSNALANRLYKIAKEEPIEIEMVGLCTDICVVSNALLIKAKLPEVKITVDSKCCAGVTPEKHESALETMRSCQIIVK